MAGKSPVTTSDDQRAGLLALAGSRDRGEADRARAVLLTLAGWTSSRIAEAFGVREDTVRLWRSDFMRGGVAALKAHAAPGPAPMKSEAALRVVTPLLEEPVADRRNWTIPGCAPRSKRVRVSASADHNCPRRCEKKVPLAATPAHPEGTPDRRRDRTGRPASAVAQAAGRSRRHCSALWRRERGVDASLSRPRLGQGGGGPACAGTRPGQEGRYAGLARSRHAPTHCPHQPDQAEQRLRRPSRATGPALWSQARSAGQAGGVGRGQWSDPYQQALAGGAGRPGALAYRRVAAQVCARIERHRDRLA